MPECRVILDKDRMILSGAGAEETDYNQAIIFKAILFTITIFKEGHTL